MLTEIKTETHIKQQKQMLNKLNGIIIFPFSL